MPSYGNFQNDNNKYTDKLSRTDPTNPAFMPAIAVVSKSQQNTFEKNEKKWANIVSYLRWYPDVFWRLITPKTGGIRLDLDQCVFLRALARFPNGYYTFSRAYGKCVTGDTLLFTGQGIKTMGSFFCNQGDNKETIYSHDIEIVNRYGEVEKSNKGIYSGMKPTIVLTTESGYSLEGTYIHPILVKNEQGDFLFKKLFEIKVGDEICILKGANLWGNNSKIILNNDNCFTEVNLETARLIGLLIAKNAFKQGKIALKSKIKAKKDFIEHSNLLNLVDELDKYDFKVIPDSIMSAPREIVEEVVKTIFDSQGKKTLKGISLKTTSFELARQLQMILLNMGIICSFEKRKNGFCVKIDNKALHYTEKGYYYDKVRTIEFSENNVYDLQTLDTHSFVGNGFINHNTMLEVMGLIHTAIFYPRIKLALTAQNMKKAAGLLKQKYNDLIKFYPLLKEEVYLAKFSGDSASIEFNNGSVIDILANAQSTKGERRHRGSIEEDNLVDENVYNDAVRPVFDDPRRTIGRFGRIDPNENNSSINSFTTAGYRGSPAYNRCLRTYKGMLALDGSFCLGASWKLAAFNGRGKDINEILKDKKTQSPFIFDMNYMSRWTGSGDRGICNISKLLECRNLPMPEMSSEFPEVVLSVDVAQSDKDKNCQTVITVFDIVRYSNGRVKEIRVPYIIAISGKLNYTAQSIDVKRLKNKYKAVAIVVDNNGLGRGLTGELLKEQIDPETGEKLDCLDTINTEDLPEIPNSDKCVFAYVAQSYDQESIPTLMECIETGKVRFLAVKDYEDFAYLSDDKRREVMLPFIQTNFLIDEIENIVLKVLNNGKLSIERATTRLQKDRFSSLQYGLWYIMKNMDNITVDDDDDIDVLAKYIQW